MTLSGCNTWETRSLNPTVVSSVHVFIAFGFDGQLHPSIEILVLDAPLALLHGAEEQLLHTYDLLSLLLHQSWSSQSLGIFDLIAAIKGAPHLCRCIGATNKALAKRRAAEDALRIIMEKDDAADLAAAAAEALAKEAADAIAGSAATTNNLPGDSAAKPAAGEAADGMAHKAITTATTTAVAAGAAGVGAASLTLTQQQQIPGTANTEQARPDVAAPAEAVYPQHIPAPQPVAADTHMADTPPAQTAEHAADTQMPDAQTAQQAADTYMPYAQTAQRAAAGPASPPVQMHSAQPADRGAAAGPSHPPDTDPSFSHSQPSAGPITQTVHAPPSAFSLPLPSARLTELTNLAAPTTTAGAVLTTPAVAAASFLSAPTATGSAPTAESNSPRKLPAAVHTDAGVMTDVTMPDAAGVSSPADVGKSKAPTANLAPTDVRLEQPSLSQGLNETETTHKQAWGDVALDDFAY